MSVTPTVRLLQVCRESPSLAHHPDIARALVNRNAEVILEHLRRQRAWLGELHTNARARLEVRNSIVLQHAKAAAAALTTYEQCLLTAS